MDVNDLRMRRAELAGRLRSTLDRAKAERRTLTPEERTACNSARPELEHLALEIALLENERALDEALDGGGRPLTTEYAVESPPQRQSFPALPGYRGAFDSYLRRGLPGLEPGQAQMIRANYEARALGADGTAAAGGALTSQEFYNRLIEAMKAVGGVMQTRATRFPTSAGGDMPIPLVDDTANVGAILAENTQVTEQDFAFSQKTLGAYMYTSKLVRVSFQLLQDSAVDLEGYLARALGTRIGRVLNQHFTNGTGVGQPQGVVAAAPTGATAGGATAIVYSDLVKLFHAVDPLYRTNAEWMFSDGVLQVLDLLVDTQGRPLLRVDALGGGPTTILGRPFVINQDMAAAPVAATKTIAFGDFSTYLIRDVLDLRVLRLTERYADYLQVGFLAFLRTDALLAAANATSQSPVKLLAQP